jgi:hypothetical protein
MTDLEKLAIAQGLYKAVGAIVSTKDPNSLRSQLDMTLMDMYGGTPPVDRIVLEINGTEVGKLSISRKKATHKAEVVVEDTAAMWAWLHNEADETLLEDIVPTIAKALDAYVERTGDVPDGCSVRHIDTPEGIAGTTITGCKPEDVAAALGSELPAAVVGLLEAE